MNNGHSFQTKYATEAYAESRDLWDKPIFESESFVAVPTVGALVEGWLLVVPKIFELSFARLPSRQLSELDEFLEEIVPSMESAYGSVSVFEHGAAAANNLIGCGVDYAHLHLVPNRCDLLKAAQKIAPNIHWNQIKSLDAIKQTALFVEGYWFLRQNYRTDLCYIGRCDDGKPVSQLFRRVIANHIGDSSSYDWKTSLGESNVIATVEKMSQRSLFA
jgi:diadenosine tetraphosphate (Ap4A) HIT family hydrolase